MQWVFWMVFRYYVQLDAILCIYNCNHDLIELPKLPRPAAYERNMQLSATCWRKCTIIITLAETPCTLLTVVLHLKSISSNQSIDLVNQLTNLLVWFVCKLQREGYWTVFFCGRHSNVNSFNYRQLPWGLWDKNDPRGSSLLGKVNSVAGVPRVTMCGVSLFLREFIHDWWFTTANVITFTSSWRRAVCCSTLHMLIH